MYIASGNNKNITIMKKMGLIMLIATMYCGGICYVICANLAGNGKENDSSDKYIWEHQMDYVKEHNTVADCPLKFLGYKYLKPINDIKTVEEYIKKAFASDAYMAIDAPLHKYKFDVFQRKTLEKMAGKQDFDIATSIKAREKMASERISIGMTHIVELTWSYHGKKFKTWALVTNGSDGLLYDNVATFARSPRPDVGPTWEKYLKK